MRTMQAFPILRLSISLIGGISAIASASVVTSTDHKGLHGNVPAMTQAQGADVTPDAARPVLTAQFASPVYANENSFGRQISGASQQVATRPGTDRVSVAGAADAQPDGPEPGLFSAIASTLSLAAFFFFRRMR